MSPTSTMGSTGFSSRRDPLSPMAKTGLAMFKSEATSGSPMAPGGASSPPASPKVTRCSSAPSMQRDKPDFRSIDYTLPGNDMINILEDCADAQRMKNIQRHRGKPLYSGGTSTWLSTNKTHFQNWFTTQ